MWHSALVAQKGNLYSFLGMPVLSVQQKIFIALKLYAMSLSNLYRATQRNT